MDTTKFTPWNAIDAQLSPPVLSFLTDRLKFGGAAPVQATVIPLLQRGKDVVVEAITGSGKTLAFLIPAAELLLAPRTREVCRNNKHSVIVACMFPTRELANQVHAIAKDMIQFLNSKMAAAQQHGGKNNNAAASAAVVKYSEACFVGGHAVAKDLATFQDLGAHLLLGTPGRLNELLVTCKESVCFEMSHFEMLILDEADRLLECGFRPTLDSLLRRLPKQRRTALFSATQSRELADLARAGTRNPLLVTVRENPSNNNNNNNNRSQQQDSAAGSATAASSSGDQQKAQIPTRLTNRFQVTRYADKLDALMAYLRPVVRDTKILIYVITCASVEWLHSALQVLFAAESSSTTASGAAAAAAPPPIFALHGQMSMEQRSKVHKAASAARAATVICSDVAARGLDLPNVRHVIQFDAPTDPRTFVHRIGRTARMGQAGETLLLLSPLERDYVPFMELQNVTLEEHRPRRWGNADNAAARQRDDDDDDDDEDDEDGDNNENDDAASSVNRSIDKRRTMQSVMADRLKLKAARGRTTALAKKRQALKDKRRSVVAAGDLCEAPCIITLRRAAAQGNATLLARAARAFVSFIRAYKEHECRNIFRLQYIDVTDLVNGFALFFVPNCGEIRMMNQLRIPLQPEFNAFVAQLDEQRKENHAARNAARQEEQHQLQEEQAMETLINVPVVVSAATVAAAPSRRNKKKQQQHQQQNNDHDDAEVTAPTNAEIDDEDDVDEEEATNAAGAAAAAIQTTTGRRPKKTVHEMARNEKQRIRDSHMSQTAKRRAWAAADMAELRREAFLLRKEKRGQMPSSLVDELLGDDAVDNAHLSTRERKQRRRTRSQ